MLGLAPTTKSVMCLPNRDIVKRKMKADVLCSGYQVHSSVVSVIAGRAWDVDNAPDCDAIVTNQEKILIGVLSADCGPVLFADKEARVVGCAHAGWRGAMDGVLENTVKEMMNLGAKKKNIIAILGPCIAQDSYEVSEDFRFLFLAENAKNVVYFKSSGMKYLFDLKGYIENRLNKLKNWVCKYNVRRHIQR